MTHYFLSKTLVAIILPLFLAACTPSETDDVTKQNNLESLVGYYSLPSPLCSSQNDGECKQSVDCLQIHKKDSTQYQVELYSVQANQHLCAFDVTMSAKGNKLLYQNDDGWKMVLAVSDDKLLLNTSKISSNSGFCGAQASIDGLAFAVSSKQPEGRVEGRVCFKDE